MSPSMTVAFASPQLTAAVAARGESANIEPEATAQLVEVANVFLKDERAELIGLKIDYEQSNLQKVLG